jgi:hypothetical protein
MQFEKAVELLQVEPIMREFLNRNIYKKLTKQRGPVKWPSRSPDLTSLVFLLCLRPK